MSDTFEFDDKARVERLVGTLHDPAATTGDVLTVQADKSIAAQAGGGASVQAVYGGNNVSINNTESDPLTWDTLSSGNDLLDRSSLTAPTFIAAGTYAISVVLHGDALTAAGHAVGYIGATGSNPLTYAASQFPASYWGAAAVVVAAAGDFLLAAVGNFDGVSARNFSLAVATVVKLS